MGPKARLDVFGEENNLLHLAGFEPRLVQTSTESLYRLRRPGSRFTFDLLTV